MVDQPVGEPVVGWRQRELPPQSSLTGRYCTLERLNLAVHGIDLTNAFHGSPDAAWTYLPYGPFSDRADVTVWLETRAASSDPLFHAIRDSQTGHAAGLASLMRIDPSNGVIEVGHIHFSPSLKQTPAATEAIFLLMGRVFDELGYRRLEWKCDALNTPSRRAAERLGFTYEGTFRQASIVKGRNRDTAWFSMLDREWPQIKRGFEAWLAPVNFDSKHRQRTTLLQARSATAAKLD